MKSREATEINDYPHKQAWISVTQVYKERATSDKTIVNRLCKAFTTLMCEWWGWGRKCIPCPKRFKSFHSIFCFRMKIFKLSVPMSCYQKLQKWCLNLHQSKDNWNKITGLRLIECKSQHKRYLPLNTQRLNQRLYQLGRCSTLISLPTLNTLLKTRPHWPCTYV